MAYNSPIMSVKEYEEKKEQDRIEWLIHTGAGEQFFALSAVSLMEGLRWQRETDPVTWIIPYTKLVAAQYLRFLTGNRPRQSVEGFSASSSYHYPFLSLMAQEVGMSTEDTAVLCDRIISAGDEAAERSSPHILRIAQYDYKGGLSYRVGMCRTHFLMDSTLATLRPDQVTLATLLPDQVALLVHARILDELL